MAENKSTLFGIIALIIGASGLGLGAFSVVNFQVVEGPEGPQGVPGDDGQDGIDGIDGLNGINGTDGIDAPFYCCSSRSEIEQALDTIGTGHGTIFITEDITLTEDIPIIIDGGGSYIIQGISPGITIKCFYDTTFIVITNTTSCLIKDLVIDARLGMQEWTVIVIQEVADNPVYIESIRIWEDQIPRVTGIEINSNNVWVSNCYFDGFLIGIFIMDKRNHIQHNTFDSCSNTILCLDDYNMIDSNEFLFCVSGIIMGSNINSITNNFFIEISYGITISNGADNFVTGNNIYGDNSDSSYGITLQGDSLRNHIGSNRISNFTNLGSGTEYGLYIQDSTCENNTVIANAFISNEIHFSDNGINTFNISNCFT